MAAKRREIIGKKFGMLTALKHVGETSLGRYRFECLCDCGKTVIRGQDSLTRGSSISCGCQRFEKYRTHGMTNTPTFGSWQSIIARCERPSSISYQYYGAKGVTVCERWRHSFEAFLEDMGPRPNGMSIDRINSTGNYEPGNCRWATITEQNNNKSDTRLITFNGKTMNMSAWAKEIGTSPSSLHSRIAYMGMSIEDALTIPFSRSNAGNHGKFAKAKT